MVKRLAKKSEPVQSYKILNLSVILISIAFIIGTAGIYEPQNGFFHRLNEISGGGMTGHAIDTSKCLAGMISYWTFDDGTAYDLFDKNPGTLFGGVSRARGKIGDALQFDGSSGYIQTITSISWPNTRSVSLWINMSKRSTHILNTKAGQLNRAEYLNSDSNGNLHIILQMTENDGPNVQAASATSLISNEWTYVAYTVDGVTGTTRLYINGYLSAESVSNEWKTPPITRPWVFGAYHYDLGNQYQLFFGGQLDEIAIYNRVLTADEIKAQYNNANNGINYCGITITAPICRSMGGELNNTVTYSCLNSTGGTLNVNFASPDSSGTLTCCNLSIAKWYEQFSIESESCPKNGNRERNITTATHPGHQYCEKGYKFGITTETVCQNKGGIGYDNNTFECTEGNEIPVQGYACCNASESWFIRVKSCWDQTRSPKGEECNTDWHCPQDKKIIASNTAECCQQGACAYGAEPKKNCFDLGEYVKCNITAGQSCRYPVENAADNNLSETNNIMCCQVACNNTVLNEDFESDVDKCSNAGIEWNCNLWQGLKCPTTKWKASAIDSPGNQQCCSQPCNWLKCADLNAPGLTDFKLCAKGKCIGSIVGSNDTSSTTVGQCCRGVCLAPYNASNQCTPQCAFKVCGDPDGCGTGGKCQTQTCGSGQTCVNGACQSSSGTCSDRQKNQDETEIDCGGPNCPACVPVQVARCANLPIGTRTGSQYCNASQIMANQKSKGDSCSNDYECTSNFCQDRKCTSLSKTLDLIPRIWCWLQAWIAYPASKDSRSLDACDCMCGFFSTGTSHDYIQEDCVKSYSSTYTCPK